MKTASALIRLDEICSQNYEWEQENFSELALLMWSCHGLNNLVIPKKGRKKKHKLQVKCGKEIIQLNMWEESTIVIIHM